MKLRIRVVWIIVFLGVYSPNAVSDVNEKIFYSTNGKVLCVYVNLYDFQGDPHLVEEAVKTVNWKFSENSLGLH